MKTIITAIAFILLSSACYGQEVKTVKFKKYKPMEAATVCLNGYLFAVVNGMSGASIVQIFKDGAFPSAPSDPIKCKG